MSATMNKHHHTIGKGLIPSMVIQVLGCPHSWWHPSCWWSKFILLNHRTLLGSSLKQYVLDELLIPEWKIEHGFPIDKPPSKEGPWLRQEDGCYQMHLAAKWGLFLHLVSLFWAGKHWNDCLKFGWNSHWPHSGCFFFRLKQEMNGTLFGTLFQRRECHGSSITVQWNPRRNSGTEWFIMIHPLGQRWVKIQPYSTPLRNCDRNIRQLLGKWVRTTYLSCKLQRMMNSKLPQTNQKTISEGVFV